MNAFKTIYCVLIALLIIANSMDAPFACGLKADRVLVKKKEHKLYLIKDGRIFREYTISLGLNPVGHKQQKGDKRTPEGSYLLDRRNPKSKFYKSIHISYPNERDRRAALAKGVDPGGDLAIHGLPTESEDEAWDYIERDWTDGCIAVTNEEMEEIWNLIDDGTPIEIMP